MKLSQNITCDKFPRQGDLIGQDVQVAFGYDTVNAISGKVVRDDLEDPYITIIRLNDGRHVLSTECQYKTSGITQPLSVNPSLLVLN